MNDEIREILENQASGGYKDLKSLQAQYIIDYITNLQKENDDLKNRLENAVADCNLRLQENEELKKNQRYYKNGVFSLEYDKETLSDMVDDYKSRIEKAVEYLKYQLENLDFYEDTKARMLCAMGITLLQNGSDEK